MAFSHASANSLIALLAGYFEPEISDKHIDNFTLRTREAEEALRKIKSSPPNQFDLIEELVNTWIKVSVRRNAILHWSIIGSRNLKEDYPLDARTLVA